MSATADTGTAEDTSGAIRRPHRAHGFPRGALAWPGCSPSGKAAVTYRVEAGVCLAGGDPVGDREA
jgi:hypothetical protein